ncbi:caspase-8 [Mycolicibacterium novocastrense]|uniref:Caspase-8 n=1 Tax=Mycolicibacterium novocastrense TaxID=59813 RepID=A0ABQ0KCY2_MYCNV|nr:caspase-8 [Mycolicibacterium novocastrense]
MNLPFPLLKGRFPSDRGDAVTTVATLEQNVRAPDYDHVGHTTFRSVCAFPDGGDNDHNTQTTPQAVAPRATVVATPGSTHN